MSWKRIRIPEKEYDKKRGAVQSQFQECCARHGHPVGAEIYEHPVLTTVGRTLFLTPQAAEIVGPELAGLVLEDCDQPDTSELNSIDKCWS